MTMAGCLLLVLLSLLEASTTSAQTVRVYAGEFLQLGVGARSLALGGAGVAISDDATAGYFNPAGLNSIRYPMIEAMHEARFDGIVQYNYGALAIPIGWNSTVALSVVQVGVSDIKDTRNALIDLNKNGVLDPTEYFDYDNGKITTFSNGDWGFILSYAKRGLDAADTDFDYGASAKFIYRRITDDNSGIGLGFDAGIRYRATPSLTLGAVAQDVTTTLLSYSTGTKELISPTLKLGGAYQINISSNGFHRLLPTADLDLRFENRGSVAQFHAGPISMDAHLGLEYQLGSILAIRGGYNDLGMWSVGAGLHFSRLSIDYSFLNFNGQDQLGNSHRVSIAFSLEQPKWKRKDLPGSIL